MKKKFRILLIMAAALSIGTTLLASRPSHWDEDARRRKAEYMYVEAERQSAVGHDGAKMELYRRAYDLDSSNVELYSDLGLGYVRLVRNDEALLGHAIRLINKKFDCDPTDLNNAYIYAQILESIKRPESALAVWATIDSLSPSRPDLSLMYVDALVKQGDSTALVKAVERLKGLEVANGVNMEFSRRKIGIYALLGDTAAAISSARQLIDASPLAPSSYIVAGNFFASIEQPDSAIHYLRMGRDVDPADGEAAYALAEYYNELGDTVGYAREIDNALLATDLDVSDKHDILLDYTRKYIGDSTLLPHLDSLFVRVIDRYPQELELRKLYADYLSTTQRYDLSAEQREMVLDLDPADEENWMRAAVNYLMDGDRTADALSVLKRSLKYHDGSDKIHSMLGSVYVNSDTAGHYGMARREFMRAYELADTLDAEKRSNYICNIGDIFYQEENMDSAAVYYQSALDIYPKNNMARNNYAYHLSETSADSAALDKADELSYYTVTLEPDNAVYLDTYAWILFRKHDYKRAKDFIDRAMAHVDDPEQLSAEYYSHAGDIYFWNDEPQKALEFWTKALELDPGNELLARKVKYKTFFHE